MSEFEFNYCGVCVNPHLPISIRKGNSYLSILTAETEKGWVYGFHVMCVDRGIGGGCTLRGEFYITEDAAINHALRHVRQYLQRAADDLNAEGSVRRVAKQLLNEIETLLPKYSYKILDLFAE